MPKGGMGQAGICERDYTKGQRMSLRNLFSFFFVHYFPGQRPGERAHSHRSYLPTKCVSQGMIIREGRERGINGKRVFRDTYTF
jgi:hypothetical protein